MLSVNVALLFFSGRWRLGRVLGGQAAAVPVFDTAIVSLTRMYASLKSHELDFIIEVLNLILIIGVVRSS